MKEEATYDKDHICYFSDERFQEFERENNLLELIGYYRNLPSAYAGFLMCPCKVLLWKFFYIPKQLRKYSLSLPFAREIMKDFEERIGKNQKIEIIWNSNNRSMDMICRYLGMKVTYKTGVTTVGEILARGRNSEDHPV